MDSSGVDCVDCHAVGTLARMRVPATIAVVALGIAALWWITAGRGGAESPEAVALPPSSTDPDLTFDDLLARATPDEQGEVELSVTSEELTAAANNGLPVDAPVDDVDLELRDDNGDITVDFVAGLRDRGLDITGSVALDRVDGRVEPRLLEARAGVLPLGGPLRTPVENVVRDASALFAQLAAQGVEVADLELGDQGLTISGTVTE